MAVGSLVFFVLTQVLLHALAFAIAIATSRPGVGALPRQLILLGITAGLGFMLLIMTSRALSGAIQALYIRSDLDLLLSSPLAPNSILAVRAAAIALTVTGEVAMLLWPFANVFVLFGRIEWLKAYIRLPAIGMLATSIALFAMVGLFRVLGPRRTRVFMQIAAAVIGMSFVLLVQLPNVMRDGEPGAGTARALRSVNTEAEGPLWFAARQVLDGFVPTITFAVICAAALITTVRLLRNRFIDASTLVAGISSSSGRRARSSVMQFQHGIRRVLIRKELRLIARDPWLLTQLLGQFVFLVPLALLMWRQSAGGGIPWVWLGIIFVCGSIVSSLAWLTVSAEDSPELLASSPVPASAILRLKIETALLPVVPLLFVPVIVLGGSYPVYAIALAFCSAGAGISCALLQIRNPVARKRADFKSRHKGRGISGLIETAVIAVWVGLCAVIAVFA